MTTLSAQTKQDTLLGQVVISKELATKEQVEDCLSMQAELAKEHNQRSLADLLVENGYVTRSQVERLRPQVDEQGGVQQIPGYQILSKLGAGAMAAVFKARQISLDRMVAIKVLPKRMSENKEFVDRFYKEGKAAAKLNHPNIVGAVDVGEAEPLDVRARADDPLAEGVLVEDQAARDIVGVDLDAFLVVVLVDLLEDERPLELDVGEPRAAEQLAEQVDARRHHEPVVGELCAAAERDGVRLRIDRRGGLERERHARA